MWGCSERPEHQPPSVPKNTARARSSRSSSSCAGALEPHLALLEEDRAVGDRERDVERLLDDEHRLPAFLQPVDELEHALHDDRRETERQLVDQEDLGIVHQHAGEREHLLLPAREAARGLLLALARARGRARASRRPGASISRVRAAVEPGAHAEVLRDGEAREHALAAGELHDADARARLRARRR